jgi:hypothetical protein
MCRPTTASIYAFAANHQTSMASQIPSPDAGGSPRKSVLICPGCSHESRASGDWREHYCDTAGGPKLALVCPECETEITYRPPPKDSHDERAIPVTR